MQRSFIGSTRRAGLLYVRTDHHARADRQGGGVNRRQSWRGLACRAASFRLPSTTQPKCAQPLKKTGG